MVLIMLSIINQPGPIVRAIVTPTLGVYLPLALKSVDTPTVLPTPSFTPTPTWTPTPTPSPTATPTSVPPANIKITFIEYNPPGDDEDGEFVRIRNLGGTAQTMTQWILRDVANHVFTFPGFTLSAGATVQVWTGVGTDNNTHLYWASGAPIWNNTGDTATLINSGGQVVSACSYSGGGQNHACP